LSVYHWLVILILFFAFIMHGGRKGNTAFIVVAAILMFCLLGLRDCKTIGNDSRTSYLSQFYSDGQKDWEDLRDIRDWGRIGSDDSDSGHDRNFGLQWLMKIVYVVSGGQYQWFIVIAAVIVLVSESVYIQKYSPSPLQSVLYFLGLLLYMFHFSATKQSMAMCILLFSFPAIIEKKPIRFVALVVVASFFHFPALVFLPAYWIGNLRMRNGYLIVLAITFILAFFFRDSLVNLMTDTYGTELDTGTHMRFLANKVLVMLVIIITALIVRPLDPEDRVYNVLMHLTGVAAVIQTFASYNNTFERLADYYFQYAVVLIPMIFEEVQTKRKYLNNETLNLVRSYGTVVACAFAIWRFLAVMISDGHFYPFRFFFEQ